MVWFLMLALLERFQMDLVGIEGFTGVMDEFRGHLT